MHRQVAYLQKTLVQAMERLEELTEAEHNRAAATSKATTSVSGSCSDITGESTAPATGVMPQRGFGHATGRGRGLCRSRQSDTCTRCGKLGHCARECEQ